MSDSSYCSLFGDHKSDPCQCGYGSDKNKSQLLDKIKALSIIDRRMLLCKFCPICSSSNPIDCDLNFHAGYKSFGTEANPSDQRAGLPGSSEKS